MLPCSLISVTVCIEYKCKFEDSLLFGVLITLSFIYNKMLVKRMTCAIYALCVWRQTVSIIYDTKGK